MLITTNWQKTRETADALGIGQLFWPDLERLTEGSSEPFMKMIILNNALRDITLFQEFALSMLYGTDEGEWSSGGGHNCKPECIRALGPRSGQNTIPASEDTRIPQEEGPRRAVHRDQASDHELDGAPRRQDYHASTMHNPSVTSRQPVELKPGASLESSPLPEIVTTGSQNCMSAITKLVAHPGCLPLIYL